MSSLINFIRNCFETFRPSFFLEFMFAYNSYFKIKKNFRNYLDLHKLTSNRKQKEAKRNLKAT